MSGLLKFTGPCLLGLGALAGAFLLGFASTLFSPLFDAGFSLGERVASNPSEPDAEARA